MLLLLSHHEEVRQRSGQLEEGLGLCDLCLLLMLLWKVLLLLLVLPVPVSALLLLLLQTMYYMTIVQK